MSRTQSKDERLNAAQAAALIGVHVNTIRRWDSEGFLKSQRTPGGHRRYDFEQLLQFKQGLQDFERTGATLARKIFLSTRKNGE